MHPQFCVISDRPRTLLVDGLNRPHCATGPFCEWADGTRLYAWHGVRVPALWIEHPERVDPELALTHPDIEQRTALAQILGWDRVLDLVDTTTLSVETDPTTGGQIELLEAEIAEERQTFARVTGPGAHGPAGQYVLQTDPEIRTAVAAVAATYGKTAEEYARCQRRV